MVLWEIWDMVSEKKVVSAEGKTISEEQTR